MMTPSAPFAADRVDSDLGVADFAQMPEDDTWAKV